MKRIYLDNAATSWPKFQPAVDSAVRYLTECGATGGRGTYRSAQTADEWVQRARNALCKLIGGKSSSGVAFCSSGTHALNALIHGLVRPGDHIVVSAMEHNSVLRPLFGSIDDLGLTVDVVSVDQSGRIQFQELEGLLRDTTKLVCLGHASNVTGAIQNFEPWHEVRKGTKAKLLVDISQSVGYIPINVQQLGADLVASAGHKGLRALPGTGFVYVDPSLHAEIKPWLRGGTGRLSETLVGSEVWPSSVEAGSLNLPGIISMAVSAEDILLHPTEWYKLWQKPLQKLLDGLRRQTKFRIVGHADHDALDDSHARWLPVVSCQVDGWDHHDLSSVLDSSFGIETRAGLHCAALVHQFVAGGATSPGTLRLSPGHSLSDEDIAYIMQAIQQICDADC